MTVRPILIVGDPRLTTPATPVTEFDPDLTALVEDLFETNTAAPGAGLAANQVGDPRAVFVYDLVTGGRRHRGHVVNPVLETSEIPETMPHPEDDMEGCLSVPGVRYPTGRAEWARVSGVDLRNEPTTVDGTGYLARCLQHEVDHLAGHLYLDRLIGRNQRAARKMIKQCKMIEQRKLTEAGYSWHPESVDGSFEA